MHIACVGNAILDTLLAFSPAEVGEYVLDGKLQFPLGEKVLVSSSQIELGGNASNVSVGLSRLGYQASLFAEIGDDLLGNFIQQSLAAEQVETTGMIRKGKTAMDVSLNAREDRVIFVDHQERGNAFSLPYDDLYVVYLTSLGSNWEQVYSAVLEKRSEKKIVIACNPGSVQLKAKDAFISFLTQIDILVVNVQEAATLCGLEQTFEKGKDPEKTRSYIKELFESLFTRGVGVVVITDGIAGSYGASRENHDIYFCHTFDTPVLEKTGAGDAFATGFIASYLTDSSIEEALISGTANGSSVVEYVGAQKGLLKPEQLEERKKLAHRPLPMI